ncbi:filamentous hemagglutinin N-terminal domain-containing protein [Kosakonia sp. BYX6]|uniref:Filamentous hemagglutinin N-terminal domain-containing protein n=1 Tax=Kosakonia calanthes TaxID=3139408 RepID=A0ABZ3B1V5_9ENTR
MKSKKNARALMKFNPVAASILLSLPFMAQAANLNIKNGTTLNANGVPVINITTPNGNGISHNIYDDFNVDKNGVIFNNSTSGAKTILGGDIAGNSNLTAGTAKVILNEVTSNKKSTLNGMMEVAGDKAHLIIANPNGISTQGSGFINTEKATITTAKPDMQNGELKGYSVGGGIVTVGGLQSASPTEILARSVVINGQINTDELAVVAGNNYIDTDAKVLGSAPAQGLRNTYGIDVSQLGGMYANRISLLSTESGIGVRNAGVIAGGAKGIFIDSHGKFINNNGQVKAVGDTRIQTNGVMENITGSIAGKGKIYINTTKNTLTNTNAGNISAESDIYVDSGAFNNTNGKVSSGGLLALNTNNNTLTNTGKGKTAGIEAGIVALQMGKLNNRNGQIHGSYVGVQSSEIDTVSGIIESIADIDLNSTGNIDNSKGLIRSQIGGIHIETAKTFINKENITADAASSDSLGVLAGVGGIKVKAATVNNRTGKLGSSGTISVESATTIDNHTGKISANKDVSLSSTGNIENSSGRIWSEGTVSIKGGALSNSLYVGQVLGDQGVKIDLTGALNNHIGVIRSEYGDIEIKAKGVNNDGGMMLGENIDITSSSNLVNSFGLMVANKYLTIDALTDINNTYGDEFGNWYGKYFGMQGQLGGMIGRTGISITANKVDNTYSRIVSEKGALDMNVAGTIYNNHALMVSGGDSSIKADTLSNNYSTIYSAGNVDIDVTNLSNRSSGSVENNNATGIIAADKDLSLIVGSSFTNYGWISSKANGLVRVAGSLYNHNSITADGALNMDTKKTLTNYKDIVSGGALTIKSDDDIYNGGSSNMVGKSTYIEADYDVTNHGNMVADDFLSVSADRNIYNYKNMYTKGNAVINAKSVTNSGSNAVLGGVEGLELNADKASGTGTIVGL